MELKTTEQELAVAEVLLDGFDERPVDGDFVLPDYCPDMAAILTCRLEPIVLGSQWNGDRLTADGTVWIRVLYLDESRARVCTYEVSQPFSSVFTASGRLPQTAVSLSAQPEYVNCRAVSPRRLDVHGAFRVRAKAVGEGRFAAVGEVTSPDVFVRRRRVTTAVPSGSAQKAFTVTETVEAAEGETLLRTEAVPVITEYKVLAGKVIVKGDLRLKNLLFYEENGDTEVRTYTVPFSQMMDVEGLTDENTVDVDVQLLSHDVHAEADPTGAGALQSNTKLLLTAQAWREETGDAIVDAYAATAPIRLDYRVLTESRLTALTREAVTLRQQIESPEDVHRVLDVWSEAEALSGSDTDDTHTVEGRLHAHLLAADAEGHISYYERSSDFSWDFPKQGSVEEDDLHVIRTDFTVSPDHTLELTVVLSVRRVCRDESPVAAVTGMSLDEEAAFPAERASVKVVFAEAGESLWEIAKRCHTSAEVLMRENDLTADILPQRRTLLVPIVKA
ncbi:MAG: DUF3794 domain-containing protein [Clostridia bacterium]|nr:DUF3794 domain-containing protein [Clostridia bacterium]